jgi:hypothetical protein
METGPATTKALELIVELVRDRVANFDEKQRSFSN